MSFIITLIDVDANRIAKSKNNSTFYYIVLTHNVTSYVYKILRLALEDKLLLCDVKKQVKYC